jgi:hypothetical protein
VKTIFFQFSFTQSLRPLSSLFSAPPFEIVEKIRINPNNINKDPERKGINPGPGLWKSPSLNLIDPRQRATPRRNHMNPPHRSYLLIPYPLSLDPVLFFLKPK